MKNERRNKIMNVRLSKREFHLLNQLAKQKKKSKSRLFRQFLIEPIIKDEPSYTQEEIDSDRVKITKQLEEINKTILKSMLTLPLSVREGVMNKLEQLAEVLKKRP